jgi:hypothetical protein
MKCRVLLEDLADERIKRKKFLKKQGDRVWTGFVFLKIGTCGWLL